MWRMAPPTRAAASARLPAPAAFTAKAWSSACSAPSTSLKAAALMIQSGRIRSTTATTAPASVMSSWPWSKGRRSVPASVSCRSRPSCPPAPASRMINPPATLARDGVRRQSSVVPPVVIPEFRRLPFAPPVLVAAIPVDRLAQPLAEGDQRLPAEAAHPGHLERISIVVAGAVLHEMPQRAGLGAERQHAVRHLHATDLGATADVVRLAIVALPEDPRDRLDVIVDKDIVPDGGPLAIERERQILQRIRDEQ